MWRTRETFGRKLCGVWRPLAQRACASQKRSYNDLGVGWHGTFKKGGEFPNEPNLKMRNCLGMNTLRTIRVGFVLQKQGRKRGLSGGKRCRASGFLHERTQITPHSENGTHAASAATTDQFGVSRCMEEIVKLYGHERAVDGRGGWF